MQVLLVHGWAASPKMHWFPYIKRELKKRKIKVLAPRLPHPKVPNLGDWSWVIIKNLLSMKRPRVVVAHSLGGVALLRTLEGVRIPVDLAIFVSVPLHVHTKRKFLSRFFKLRYKWSIIRKNVKKAIVIHAKDDRMVPYQNGKEIARQLGCEIFSPSKGGHFDVQKFPLLLKILLK